MAKKDASYKRHWGRIVGLTLVVLCLVGASVWGFYQASFLENWFQSPGPQEPGEESSQQQQEIPEEPASQQESGSSAPQEEETLSRPETQSGDWNLVLINKTHLMPQNFPGELAEEASTGQLVDERIVQPLNEMMQGAKNSGLAIAVLCGYRPAQNSQVLLDKEIQANLALGMTQQEAYDQATQGIAPPFASEHNAGLAVDIVSSHYYNGMDLDAQQMKDLPEFQWLAEHCAEYGFILRYPQGKEEITGYMYEPWHFRYVGKEAAQAIMSQGICLEEYLQQTQ